MTPTRFMLISGIVLIVGGILALIAPFAAGVAVTLVTGWAFLIGGALNLWSALIDQADRLWHILFGLLGILLGLSFLIDPLGGLISLTILVGVLFLISGAIRLGLAWAGRAQPAYWVLLISGALSVLLGALVLSNIGGAAGALLGIILGIELLSAGIGLVTLSRMGRG
ncbi:hypothetical protein HKCCE3408_12575 [Rhodobacterales bacterium HKCCE3408]|nr:hypothetical protein [Rhodobacterales bacterium HKCCE3408]